MSNPPSATAPASCAAPAPAPRAIRVLLLLALAGYAVFLALNSTNAAGGSDSSGYINSAHLLASGRLQDAPRVPAEFGTVSSGELVYFTPLGFYPFLDNGMAPPTYPAGVPLLFALASKFVGWQLAPFFVEIGGAVAALGLCYLIARELGISPVLALAGAAVYGSYPVFIYTSIQPLSDTLAATWVLAAIFAALRARRHAGWAFACGVAFAVAVLVRSTNAILLPGLLVFVGWNWRRLALVVAGGLPGALWFGYYNHTLYGSAFLTGYGSIYGDASSGAYVPAALVDFAKWFALLLPAVLLILPFAAPLAREFRNRFLVALPLWFCAGIALFARFELSHEGWWSLRYLLPVVPALILTALLGVEALVRRFPLPRRPALLAATAAVLTVWAVAGSVHWTRKFFVLYIPHQEQAYPDSARAARETFPKDALVVSGATCGALYAYTDFPIFRGDLVEAERFAQFAAVAHAAGRPVCALIFDMEEADILRRRCPGAWTRLATVRHLGLWRLTPPAATPAPAK